MAITGEPGRGPMRAGSAISDSAAGLYCALGILTALLEREASGEGQWVEVSLLNAMIAMLDFQAARWTVDHEIPEQAGNNHPTSIPTGGVPDRRRLHEHRRRRQRNVRAAVQGAGCRRPEREAGIQGSRDALEKPRRAEQGNCRT